MAQAENITKGMFAQRLSALMKKFGATQEMISKDLGITQSAVSNYLRGRIPRADTLLELANYFGVTVHDLMSGEPSETTQKSAGLFGLESQELIADLKGDIAAAEASIRDAESKLNEAQAALKKGKEQLGVAKIVAARVDSIRKRNAK